MNAGRWFALCLTLRLASGTGASIFGEQEDEIMSGYDFSALTNVEITGASLSDFDEEQLSVLYQQARYCQAMTEQDTGTMREMISEDMVFTHMSGRQQSREEYLADIENGSLRYFTIGMENPVVDVDGDLASITCLVYPSPSTRDI